jgi:hypothetical protein
LNQPGLQRIPAGAEVADLQGPAFRPPASQASCDSHYVGGCVPSPPPKLDCAELKAFGITGVIHVVGGDPQGLDPDHDGIACD